MSDTARRVGSVLAAVLIVAAALGWGAVHEQTLVVAARVRAKSTAREVLARAAEAIAELPAPVAEQARAFGDYDALAKMLAQTTNAPEDIAQLAQTLKNTEAEEQWLRSWTDVGTVALALNGAVVFVSGGQALPAAVQALIPRAQTERVASLVAIDGAPWLVGLSPSRQPGAQLAVAVAIMIVPLDVRRLSTAAQKAGATVSVFFGERDLSAGDAVQANQLKAFRQAGALEQEPCCAIAPLVGEVKLGVYVDPSAVIAGAQAVASRDRVAAGIVGGLLAALVLGLGLRRGRSAADEHGQLLRETAAELQRSREEMQRLSQRISSGGLALPAPATESGLEQTAAAIQVSRYQLVAPLGEGGMARNQKW